MIEFRRTLRRFRMLLAVVVAIALVAAPVASFAQTELCHDAMASAAHIDHGMAASELHAKIHGLHVATAKSASEQKSVLPDNLKTCCGNGCAFCSALILSDSTSPSGASRTIRPSADTDLPVRGKTFAPLLGPPRFQA